MTNGQRSSWGSGSTFLIPIAFLLLAVVLFLVPSDFHSPAPEATVVPDWASDTTPVRQPSLTPHFTTTAATYECIECHNLFKSPPETERKLTQHSNIDLQHGTNTRCFNCHHSQNRNTFVNESGNSIDYGSPQLLCQKCHGLVYRDWQNGVHGRSGGFWLASAGETSRLICTECHDPHHPPFAPMLAAPRPNTIRTDSPLQQSDHQIAGNPLHRLQPQHLSEEPAVKNQMKTTEEEKGK